MGESALTAVPEALRNLVRRFENERDRVHDKQYKEANVRQDFLDPFFALLGWETSNSLEVQHERAIKVARETKSVDVAFKLNNRVKFMLEAKRPSLKVEGNREYAYQARSYGWNASIPFVILSDFSEFIIYDTTVRPSQSDSASVAIVESFDFSQYENKWDFLWSKFSRTAVQSGVLDEWSDAVRGKQKRISVDQALLEDIETWRIHLAKRIIASNTLEAHELAEVVQLLLDRILFLRICEGRGLEVSGRLSGLLVGSNVYDRLRHLFGLADQKYNAGLFYLDEEKGRGPPDSLSPRLQIDDDVLKEVLRGLYDKNKPYDFAVIPTEILGQVYERFLGTVLRVTASGDRVKPETKPEVKEAGGVFYTPTYIVDRIVEGTIGPLVEGKSPEEVSVLRIVDPACGSGSFLLGAYQYLMDWHLKWYLDDGVRRHKRELIDLAPGRWSLSVEERKRILRNNIFGVDIDRQATEVTKLSLFLKVVEETAGAALESNQKLFENRVLPPLDGNIKCGNSLIEPGHAPQQSFDADGLQTARRVNAFSWKQEFSSILKSGGFDAVIGNPPYIRVQALNRFAPVEVKLLRKHYISASKGNCDIYVSFLERGLQLLKPNGRLGFIVPHKFFTANYGGPIRTLLADGRHLNRITHFGDFQIFDEATTYTCLLFLSKSAETTFVFQRVLDLKRWKNGGEVQQRALQSDKATGGPWNFEAGERSALFDRLRAMPVKLGDISRIFVGTQTSMDDVYVLDDCLIDGAYVDGTCRIDGSRVRVESARVVPFLQGKEIRRYVRPSAKAYLINPYSIGPAGFDLFEADQLATNSPLTWAYLLRHKKALESREGGKMRGASWYAFAYPKSMTLFQRTKIIVPDYNNVASFTIDEGGHFYKTGFGIIPLDPGANIKYLLGLLNSTLLFEYLRHIGTGLRGGHLRFWRQYLEQFPIRIINRDDLADALAMEKMEGLVEAMLRLRDQEEQVTSVADRELIRRQISSVDAEIDLLVYELYSVSDSERILLEQPARADSPQLSGTES